jgi:hypothetical protein
MDPCDFVSTHLFESIPTVFDNKVDLWIQWKKRLASESHSRGDGGSRLVWPGCQGRKVLCMTRSLAQIHCCHWDLGRIRGVCGEALGDLCATGSWRLTRRGCRSRKALQGVIRRKRSGKYKWKCPISLQARKPSFHSIDSTTKGVTFPPDLSAANAIIPPQVATAADGAWRSIGKPA